MGKRNGKRGDGKGREPKSYVNNRGELCIGTDCVKITVPKQGPVEIDLRDCPVEDQEAIRKSVRGQGKTDYTLRDNLDASKNKSKDQK